MGDSIKLATAALVVGLALLVWSFIPGYGPQETVFADTEWTVVEDPNDPITAVRYRLRSDQDPARNKPLRVVSDSRDGDGEPAAQVYLANIRPGWYTFDFTRGQEVESLTVQVLDKEYGLLAVMGGLLAVIAGPIALIRRTRLLTRVGGQLVPVRGWTYLLMEPDGLSVARLQLVLLFVPAAVVYLALAFPLHQFPHIPDSIWQLLGIGGASAALSTLITPAAPAGATGTDLVEVPTPSVTDFFQESDGYGDISRYQSLVMCVATAVVFVVSFFDTWQVPAIPNQVLQLLGTSLAVYLGVKGIKVVKKPQAGN